MRILGIVMLGLLAFFQGMSQEQDSTVLQGMQDSTTLINADADDSEWKVEYANPRTLKIASVEVIGADYLDDRILVSISALSVGQEIDIPGDDISKGIKNLWRQGLFADIEIYVDKVVGDEVYLILKVQEQPRLSNLKIFGIKKGDIEDLEGKFINLKGRPLTDGVRVNVKNVISDFYAEKGFLKPKIEIKEIVDVNLVNSVRLNVFVEKGSKIKIDEIAFSGIQEGEERKMRKAMKETREKAKVRVFLPEDKRVFRKGNFKNTMKALANLNHATMADLFSQRVSPSLFKSSKYNEDTYEADKRALIAYYNSIGHRDAKIVSDTVYYVDNNDLKIEIDVDEGNKYYFRNIEWKGNAKYEDATLDRVLGIKKGDVYNAELLQQKINLDPSGADVSSLYYDDGYLFFSVNPVEVAVSNDSIDLEIRINEGPQATINNIIIKGNDRTNEHVIRRELRTQPGQKFSRSDLIRSQREIANLGFFDAEQMGVVPIPNPQDGTVDIEYSVVEKSADQIELSAGWGGNQGLIGTLGLSFNNFSLKNMFKKGTWSPLPTGDGQKLSLRIQSNGKRYQSYNFSFTEPWLGGKKPNALTVSAFRSRFSNLDVNNAATGRQITNGASIALGTRLKRPDDFFIFQGALNYQNYNLTNFNQFIGDAGSVSNGNFNNFNLRLTLSRNSIDQPLYPTGGADVNTSVQFTPPYSKMSGRDLSDLSNEEKYKWVEYHKWRLNLNFYTSLSKPGREKKVVLKTAAKFGYLGSYNKDLGISPFERFQVGGNGLPSNITLFGLETIAQRGYNEYSQDGGDAIFNKFTLELRYPFSLNPTATVYGLIFMEAANSYPNFREYNPFKLNKAVGFGLRAFLPMFGLLGVDYGIRFDNAPGSPIESASGFFDYIGKNGEFSIILGFEPE